MNARCIFTKDQNAVTAEEPEKKNEFRCDKTIDLTALTVAMTNIRVNKS
jgi:hypothetical protein